MIAEAAAHRVEDWLDQARGLQARVLVGGERDGSFLQPTVLWDAQRHEGL